MAIQNYIGWASNVNKIILDSTTISVGKDATKSSETGTGKEITTLKGSFVPDEFPVEMEFDCFKIIENTGKTEYQLFLEWYKYQHKFGTVPFEFPKILYSPQTGIKVYDDGKIFNSEFYKITSAVDGNKNGNCIKVKMTWKTVYSGVVTIPEVNSEISGITKATRDYIDVSFASIGNTEPNSTEFTLYINDNQVDLYGYCYNSKVARLYYPTLPVGSHKITFSYISNSYGVGKGDFVAGVEV